MTSSGAPPNPYKSLIFRPQGSQKRVPIYRDSLLHFILEFPMYLNRVFFSNRFVTQRCAIKIAVERDINSWNVGSRFGLQKYTYLLKKFNLFLLFFFTINEMPVQNYIVNDTG
jgi:hypothetical protein